MNLSLGAMGAYARQLGQRSHALTFRARPGLPIQRSSSVA